MTNDSNVEFNEEFFNSPQNQVTNPDSRVKMSYVINVKIKRLKRWIQKEKFLTQVFR